MTKPELLAPAGNMEALRAAVLAGCDAIYIGGYAFSARSFAGNFSDEEIIEAIKYCHLYGVKLFVTVNTIIYEKEVDRFINYIDFLHLNNVDAIIVQDLGMMDLIRRIYPNLEIHASTQMHVHNLDGVKVLENLGIKRCVLARETSIEEVNRIKKNTSIAIEIFVHGALCVSYSGQCLFSSLIGNRSANRGTCAQSCRQKYSLMINDKKVARNKYLLSMRDLNTIENIKELIESGIDSFKIEGRMKRPEYVYLIVSLYRKAIDNYFEFGETKITEEEIKDLYKMFNRKFTKGFLFNDPLITNIEKPNHMGIDLGNVVKVNNNMISIKLHDVLRKQDGIRIIGQNDIGFNVTEIYKNNKKIEQGNIGDIVELKISDSVLINSKVVKTTDIKQIKDINDNLKEKKRNILIHIEVNCVNDKQLELIISDKQNEIKVHSDFVITKAIKNKTTESDILKQIDRFGETIYKIDNIKIFVDDDIFVPNSIINNLRREATKKLDEKRLYKINYKKEIYKIEVPNFNKTNYHNYLISTEEHYNNIKNKDINIIYVEDEELYKKVKDDKRVCLKLNRVIKNYNLYNDYDKLLVGEIGGLRLENVDTDFSFNVVNSYTVAFLHSIGVKKITLSHELNELQISDIVVNYQNRYNKIPNLEVIVYGKEEVMINKFNLLVDNKKGYLIDRFNNKYLIKNNNEFMTIYNYKIRNDKIDYFKIGINNIRYNYID